MLRIKQVSEKTSKGPSTIWADVKKGTFPKPVKLSPKTTAWTDESIDIWLKEKIAESQS